MKTVKIILGIILIFLVLRLLEQTTNTPKTKLYYPLVQESVANVNHYYIYGQTFNLEGLIEKTVDKEKIEDISLVLISEHIEIYVNTIYEIKENSIEFKIADEVNGGINLDNIEKGRYFLVLKIYYTNNQAEYYSLINNTTFENLDYYTITNDSKNNYVSIEFIKKQKDDKLLSFLNINVTEKQLPASVYDIVIDPGHGGIDSGAVVNDVYESYVVLEICIKLKEELEKIGLKVKLTREGNYNPGGNGVDPYWDEGRVNTPNNVRAKYLFSIHLNSAPYKMKKGGVEIYSPYNANLELAKLLASNIVEHAKTRYSPNNLNKQADGVYVRTFTTKEIAEAVVNAKNNNYAPYNITTKTPYHYIVREPGGITTSAYIDGRNKKNNKNHYYNSNIGVESYLVELGFMVNDYDLNNMLHNKQGYVLGIVEGIRKFLY